MILTKNPIIQETTKEDINDISVTYCDLTKKFAVLKVTPKIRECIKKDWRIFIGMQAFRVTDHHHVTQCFACQGFGHVYGSELNDAPKMTSPQSVCSALVATVLQHATVKNIQTVIDA